MSYNFDPELAEAISMLPTADFSDVEASRKMLDDLLGTINADVDLTHLLVEDRAIAGPEAGVEVPIRRYSPLGDAGTRPAVLYIHGGGFVIGSVESEHAQAAAIANAGVVVVSVEYRLAPEHPFPAGLEDCYAALRWIHDRAGDLGADVERVAVFGQSAGGGLAAATALLARDRGGPPLCFQYLGIPELDDRLETVSMQAFADTPLWNRPNAVLSWQFYLGGQPASVYAAPARATDLTGLPPAYISTMEFDPLRDEGITYALRLLQAGVSVELHQYPGTFHGSSIVNTAAVSKRQAAETLEVVRRRLGV